MYGKIIKAMSAFILLTAVAASAQLRVGVGKVDVTPDEGKLPEPFVSIHDHLFTRAILIENGKSSGLLMNMDVGKISAALFAQISQGISKQYGIPVDNMVISAVHDHASVSSLGGGDALSGRPVSPNMQAFIDKVHAGMLEAVKQAKASLQPAEIGFGEGKLLLNVNRDGIDPKTRQWSEKPNPNFTSDKTLAVVEFRKPNGEPIAVYLNYAMHAITMFLTMQISGDFPESAEQYIENAYDNNVVAIWTIAPAGDQDPLYLRPILKIGEQRIRQEMDPAKTGDAAKTEYSAAMIRLFNGPVQRPLQPIDPTLAAQAWRVVEAIGTLTGEEAIRVMDGITGFTGNAVIQGSSKVVSCPTRPRPTTAVGPGGSPQPTPAANAQAAPAAPAPPPPLMQIKVGALRIGDVAIARNDSELYNQFGQETKEGSPFRKTLVVGLANGGGGYVPTDDAFGRGTFQVAGNRLIQGCAEMGVVNAIDGLLEQDILSTPGN